MRISFIFNIAFWVFNPSMTILVACMSQRQSQGNKDEIIRLKESYPVLLGLPNISWHNISQHFQII
jgi:hypothetical protein